MHSAGFLHKENVQKPGLFFLFYQKKNEKNKWNNGGCIVPQNIIVQDENFRINPDDFIPVLISMTPAASLTKPEMQGARADDAVPFDGKLISVTNRDVNPHKGLIAVIPAYNEQIALGSVVLQVRQHVDRVIVVDDGSKDRTSEVARMAGAEVIRLDENMGKAYALLLGLKRARELNCTAAIMLDADGQHHTSDIPRIAAWAMNGDADLVIGSRFIANKKGIPLYRQAGQKTLNLFTNVGANVKVSDSQSGFRALSRKALNYLDFKSDGYNVESDMIAHFVANGLVLKEVPIDVRYEVPNKHKKNPVSHGMGVLASLINLISYRRPLLAFGIPGLIFIIIGLFFGSWAFTEYYSIGKFSFILSTLSGISLILGLLLVIAGLILNTLVRIVNECR
jgi:glycosyltransferase involved in cell wall biosynthesis